MSTPTLLPHLHTDAQMEIARHIRHADGSRRYGDLNSFLQVNRALYLHLNHKLWKEAVEDAALATRVFVHVITNNNITGLQRLLESGADHELRLPGLRLIDLDNDMFDYQRFQQTPLVLAACVDNLAMATVLLAKGADVEYRIASTSSYSPLHAARSPTMVDILLDHNADPQWLDEGGYPPLIWYIGRLDSACLRAILQRGAEVNGGWLVPLCAAAELDLGIVQLLLNHGADLNARTPSGDSVLHYAATAGNLDIVSFLARQWPEGLRTTDSDGFTPLHAAAYRGKLAVVKFLVQEWPQGMLEGDIGLDTPLHLAAVRGHTEVLKFLLAQWPQGSRALNINLETPLSLWRESQI